MAQYYLRNSVLELNEAAYLLGYEDANSFTRAFSRLGRCSAQSLARSLSGNDSELKTSGLSILN
jgi:AraC-like DNA-binding protein